MSVAPMDGVSAGAIIRVADEGTELAFRRKINFVGAGVSAAINGEAVDITINGISGIGAPSPGTSGGIVFYNSTTTLASTLLLAANSVVIGGGVATAPFTSAYLTLNPTTGSFQALADTHHGFGSLGAANDVIIRAAGTFAPTTPATSIFTWSSGPASTLVPAVGGSAAGFYAEPNIQKAASGTHGVFASFIAGAPVITAGASALPVAATIYISGAPTGASANYALFVGGGTSRFDGAVSATDLIAGAGNGMYWTGRSIMQAPGDGIILLTNNAGTDFGTLRLGGISSSFPALKRSGAELHARLADDSAYCAVDLLNLQVSGTQVVGAQGASIADASGGTVIDAEARTALNALLARIRTHGLIAT